MSVHALLLVDIQNDFMPFGALPVARGDDVVSVANRLAAGFDIVVATQDWHPRDHGSFASNYPGAAPGDVVDLGGVAQVLWPDHCVQGSPGASFHSALDVARIADVVRKGTDPTIDSYSGFFDNGHRKDTGMHELLSRRRVTDLVIAGLATDYCVLYTALDARDLGYGVTIVSDGVRAVDLQPGDGDAALRRMAEAGCRVVTSTEVAAAV